MNYIHKLVIDTSNNCSNNDYIQSKFQLGCNFFFLCFLCLDLSLLTHQNIYIVKHTPVRKAAAANTHPTIAIFS